MKSHYLTHGTLLIVVGMLFLLHNLGISTSIPWRSLVQLWPLFLVILGLQILFPKGILAFLAPIVLVITLFIAYVGIPTTPWSTSDYVKSTLPLQTNISQGQLTIRGLPVANVSLEANPQLDAPAVWAGMESQFVGDWQQGQTNETGVYSLSSRQDSVARFWAFNASGFPMNILLSPQLVWTMNLDIAVANGKIDLSNVAWRTLDISSGVSNLTLRLGNQSIHPARIHIKSGVGRVVLQVPHSMEIRITPSTPAFLHRLERDGLTKHQDSYVSPNYFADSGQKVDVVIDSGIATIVLEWID